MANCGKAVIFGLQIYDENMLIQQQKYSGNKRKQAHFTRIKFSSFFFGLEKIKLVRSFSGFTVQKQKKKQYKPRVFISRF